MAFLLSFHFVNLPWFEVKVLSKNILDLLRFLLLLFNNYFKPSLIEPEPRIETIST